MWTLNSLVIIFWPPYFSWKKKSMTLLALSWPPSPLSLSDTSLETSAFCYSPTTMICFLTKELYMFSVYHVNLLNKAYHRITKGILKSHNSTVCPWDDMFFYICGFRSSMLFMIDHLRRISIFCQKTHHVFYDKKTYHSVLQCLEHLISCNSKTCPV